MPYLVLVDPDRAGVPPVLRLPPAVPGQSWCKYWGWITSRSLARLLHQQYYWDIRAYSSWFHGHDQTWAKVSQIMPTYLFGTNGH